MIRRVYLVAEREFRSVIGRSGFLIGILMMPVLATLALLAPRFIREPPSAALEGTVAVVDPTGAVAGILSSAPVSAGSGRLEFIEHPAPVDLRREKGWLAEPEPATVHRIGVVVLHPNALAIPAVASLEPAYDLYVGRALDRGDEDTLNVRVSDAIITARLRSQSLDPDRIKSLDQVTRPIPVLAEGESERPGSLALQALVPFALLGLLLFASLNVGGRLLGSTLTEKSNRVMEVLLSAVSPLELMAGKIFGNLAVGLLIVGVYVALASAALSSLALLGILTPWLLVYFTAFFISTALLLAGLMGAVGAAVNDVNDARALLRPITLLLLVPWFAAVPIARNPNSPLSVVLSFLPPINSFAMLLRLTSHAPPPAWEVALTIGITLCCAAGAVWLAGRVFKVALLLQGKPPDLATLIRWARAP